MVSWNSGLIFSTTVDVVSSAPVSVYVLLINSPCEWLRDSVPYSVRVKK